LFKIIIDKVEKCGRKFLENTFTTHKEVHKIWLFVRNRIGNNDLISVNFKHQHVQAKTLPTQVPGI